MGAAIEKFAKMGGRLRNRTGIGDADAIEAKYVRAPREFLLESGRVRFGD
jgi:hypothetical protein